MYPDLSLDTMCNEIDITFDFRTDTPPGKDPDTFSDTLRRYHKLLWSKPLPNGAEFNLEFSKPSAPFYLECSGPYQIVLSSDAVVASFTRTSEKRPTEKTIAGIIKEIAAEEKDGFNTLGYTIGGMMIWPANRGNGQMTINGMRGFHPRIKDRFDLTVECIRRYYDDPSKQQNEYNPLGKTFGRYSYFFELFGDFRGFVDFFLLQDLMTEDYSAVKFHTPFEEFKTYPFPESAEEYREYKQNASSFIRARNQRILASICNSCL